MASGKDIVARIKKTITKGITMVTTEKKQELIKSFGANEKDSGNPAAQIAIMSERINQLSSHLLTHKKDFSSMRGMMKLIGQRRKLLKNLQACNVAKYEEVVKKLDLRK